MVTPWGVSDEFFLRGTNDQTWRNAAEKQKQVKREAYRSETWLRGADRKRSNILSIPVIRSYYHYVFKVEERDVRVSGEIWRDTWRKRASCADEMKEDGRGRRERRTLRRRNLRHGAEERFEEEERGSKTGKQGGNEATGVTDEQKQRWWYMTAQMRQRQTWKACEHFKLSLRLRACVCVCVLCWWWGWGSFMLHIYYSVFTSLFLTMSPLKLLPPGQWNLIKLVYMNKVKQTLSTKRERKKE